MMDLRLKAYLPNGASQGLLPAPDSFSFAIPLNDAPSLSMAYASVGPRAAILGQPLELAVEVSGDGGATWSEPDDCRFLYLRDGRDPIKTADAYAVEAPGYIWRLTKARVLDEGQAVAGKRSFSGKTVGFILTTLWQEAQARGALAGMTLTGTATQDAAGANWTAAETISRDYDLGTDYLQVVQDLANQGLLDYRMTGRTLKLYRADTVLATDRTVGNSQVQLTALTTTEAPFRRTWEGLADFLHIRGDEESNVSLTNPTGLKPWGRWEDYISQGGVTDPGTLTALGQRYQDLTAAVRAEFTQAMALGGDGPRPLLDFKAGDYIWSRVLDGTQTRYRVRQVTLQKEGSTVQGNVVLNDRFLEEDIRTRRVLEGLTGGASAGGSSGGTPAPTLPGADILAPAAPATAPALSSLAYLDEAGAIQSQITVDWPDVSTNADATPISDLDHYEVQIMSGVPGAGKTWREVTQTEAGTSIATLSPFAPQSQWSFRVRAVDSSNNWSVWSAHNTITTAVDTTPPAATSALVLTQRVGVVQADWDGLSSTAGAMDADFAYVEVHAHTVSGFAPVKGNPATLIDQLTGPGYAIAASPDYGVTYYFRTIAVDRSGNVGPPSAQAAVTINRIVGTEISDNAVTTPKLAAGSVTTDRLSVGASGINMVPNGGFQDAGTSTPIANWRLVTTNGAGGVLSRELAAPISGTASAKVVLAASTAGARLESDVFPVAPTDAVHVRIKFKLSRAIPNGVALTVCTSNSTTDPRTGGTNQDRFSLGNLPVGVYDMGSVFTVPAGHTQMAVKFSFGTSGDAAGYTGYLDNVEASLAVGDDRITTVSAGKITTGLIQANQRIVAGSLTGARAEMNAAGFLAARSDGTITFQVTASDGRARIGGTTGTRIEMSVETNIFEASQQWPLVRLYTQGPAWGPGQLWATYVSPEGTTRLSSPYATDWTKAAVLNLTGRTDGTSLAYLQAKEVNFTADTFTFGSTAGAVDFNLFGTNSFLVRQSLGSEQGVNFDLGAGGSVTVRARSKVGVTQPRLHLDGKGISLLAGAGEKVSMNGAGLDVNGLITSIGAGMEITGTGNTLTVGSAPVGGSANANISPNGFLRIISSTKRHKKNIRKLNLDLDAAYALQDRIYERRERMEGDPQFEVGFIAEEAKALGLDDWVMYDRDGKIQSFDYYRWVVALQAMVRSQHARLLALEKKGKRVG